MISVDKVKTQLEFLANDNSNTGRFSIDNLNSVFSLVQLNIVRELRKQYEKNIIIADNIADLKVLKKFQLDSQGRITKPDDYLFFSANRVKVWYKDSQGNQKVALSPVKLLRDDELADRLGSQLNPVNINYPVCVDYGSYIQFYPTKASHIEMSYIKNPDAPVWAFTEVNGRPVYNESNSTDFSLPPDMEGTVVYKCLEHLGINVKEQFTVQAGQIKAQQQNV